MPRYRVIFLYRKVDDPSVDLSDKENWDGEGLVEIETNLPFGESEGTVEEVLKEVSRRIGLENGFAVVSLTRVDEEISVEDSAFFKPSGGGDNAE